MRDSLDADLDRWQNEQNEDTDEDLEINRAEWLADSED